MDRPLAGKPLLYHFGTEGYSQWVDQESLERGGRTARTLVKDGPLRVTLIALSPGQGLAQHRADGPITVHVLSGRMRFRAGDEEWELAERDLLSLEGGVDHSVASSEGCVFLLTLALPG
jgi:quercetin dioxygenase-like cupin family protein